MSSRVIPYPTGVAVRSVRCLKPKFPLREASVVEFPVKNVKRTELTGSDRDGLGCARGVRTALAIESAIALALYGLWLVPHLLQ